MSNAHFTLLLARVGLASIFIAAAVDKAMRHAATSSSMESAGVPPILLPLVIALEAGAGLCVLAGYRTRLAAWALAAFSLAAAAIFHAAVHDPVQLAMLMKNVAIAGGLLALAAAGPGRLSVQGWASRKPQG